MWINIQRGIPIDEGWTREMRNEPTVWCETVKDYLDLLERNFDKKCLGTDFWKRVVKPTIKRYEENGLYS